MNNLIQDLLKFSENLHERQRYLERTKDMPRANIEMSALPSETVADISKEFDKLIAEYLANLTQPVPVVNYMRGCIQRELKRRETMWTI